MRQIQTSSRKCTIALKIKAPASDDDIFILSKVLVLNPPPTDSEGFVLVCVVMCTYVVTHQIVL